MSDDKITDLWIDRRMRRLQKPDGLCSYCERAANRLDPVGPITVRISEPNGETLTYEFCSWECLGCWAAIQAGFVAPNYPADPRRR